MNEFELENELEAESEHALASELEGEFAGEVGEEIPLQGEFEAEADGEQFLGGLLGNILGEGESEVEVAGELEGEFEGAGELAGEFESESEFEDEFEQEQFFGGLFKKVRGLVRRAAPMLKRIGRVAAPALKGIVGKVLPGPFGQIAGALLGEQEYELENEFEAASGRDPEFEYESEFESENEYEQEHEALAEAMAQMAAESENEHEAEAMMGSAVTLILSRRDRARLQRLIPNLVRGARLLARVLRRRPITRATLPVVNDIVRRSSRVLGRVAAGGRPVSPRIAGIVMAREARRVLGSPRHMCKVMTRSLRTARRIARPAVVRRRRAAV